MSPSPRPTTKTSIDRAPLSRRSYAAIAVIGLLALAAAGLIAMPASLMTHFMPAFIVADELSGSVWHGAAGKLSIGGRPLGAVEWQLHPAALWHLTLSGDLHWVKSGFQFSGEFEVDRHGIALRDVSGGGPIEDLRDLGLPAGWQGVADIKLARFTGEFDATGALIPQAADGEIHVGSLSSTLIAGGVSLGQFVLRTREAAPAGTLAGQVSDEGGPLQVNALVQISPKDHSGTLAGTLKERAEIPAALQEEIQNLAQMRGRDPQKRVPIDVEFNY